jgi:hypothetical protein
MDSIGVQRSDLRRPPSPLGEGESQRAQPRAENRLFPLRGERVDRAARFHQRARDGSGVSTAREKSRLPNMSNSCCLPGRAGGSPNGLEAARISELMKSGLDR